MERLADNPSSREGHLAEARKGLRTMKDWSLSQKAAGVPEGHGIYETALSVMSNLEAVVAMLTTTVETPKVPCPFCGRPTAVLASRCGFCWKRIG